MNNPRTMLSHKFEKRIVDRNLIQFIHCFYSYIDVQNNFDFYDLLPYYTCMTIFPEPITIESLNRYFEQNQNKSIKFQNENIFQLA